MNATGVVIHTNLGRAPLSRGTVLAMQEAAGYLNLEFDLASGERGDRYGHATAALCRLTGAEAALVVNNCASAVLLALSALSERLPARREGASLPVAEAGAAGRPEVLVSRGQLVEIGGGFRVPDVLRRSGADLVEVGTTNRTYLADFEGALSPRSRIVLSVHRSNFRIEGFVHDATLPELADLGRRAGVWVVDDLGSGALFPTAPFGLGDEPTVGERVAAGPDLVCFSGDKLLGGPQCGRAGRAARGRRGLPAPPAAPGAPGGQGDPGRARRHARPPRAGRGAARDPGVAGHRLERGRAAGPRRGLARRARASRRRGGGGPVGGGRRHPPRRHPPHLRAGAPAR